MLNRNVILCTQRSAIGTILTIHLESSLEINYFRNKHFHIVIITIDNYL